MGLMGLAGLVLGRARARARVRVRARAREDVECKERGVSTLHTKHAAHPSVPLYALAVAVSTPDERSNFPSPKRREPALKVSCTILTISSTTM